MKTLYPLLFFGAISTVSASILSPAGFFVSKRRLLPEENFAPKNLQRNPHQEKQDPIMGGDKIHRPNAVLPPGADNEQGGDRENEPAKPPQSDLIVSDILSKTREINIFASLTREIESVSARLNDGNKNTTVLAPTNPAIQELPRKPWEDPEDYEAFGEEEAYKGEDGESRASRNLRRFVRAHVVPESPWEEGKEITTLGGGKVSWKNGGDGKIYIQPGNIEVDRIATQVSNGEVWILKGVVNYV